MSSPDELEALLGAGIGELLRMLAGSRVTEIEIERGELRIAIRRDGREPAPEASGHDEPEPAGSRRYVLTAPMVGFFRSGSSPVANGALVSTGQVVGAVETLNVAYDVRCEHAGRVLEVLVAEGQPVEYGQPLLLIGES